MAGSVHTNLAPEDDAFGRPWLPQCIIALGGMGSTAASIGGNQNARPVVGREVTRPVGAAAETDSALVEAARNGDAESYGRLVGRYESAAHRTAYMLGAGDDTADVVQDAFMKAYGALDRFDIEAPFRPWLLTIVANETRNRWRWSSRHRTVPLALLGDHLPQAAAPSPHEIHEHRETSRMLRDAVNALPPRQREVIVCRYLLDLSEQDTAQVLRIPRGTVKSRSSRGLRALERVLAPGTPARGSAEQEPSGA
jgi:RNA polymerase sigma factor (sigma-70 family)